jgi:hypothetical protein
MMGDPGLGEEACPVDERRTVAARIGQFKLPCRATLLVLLTDGFHTTRHDACFVDNQNGIRISAVVAT